METLEQYRARVARLNTDFREDKNNQANRDYRHSQKLKETKVFEAVTDKAEIVDVESASTKGGNIALLNNFVEWANGEDAPDDGTSIMVGLMHEGGLCHGRKASSVYSALTQIISKNDELKTAVRVVKRERDKDFTQVYLVKL